MDNILNNYYKITNKPPVTGSVLVTPETKFFSFDFNNISMEENQNTTVFWNFGDPFSSENEIVISSSSNSMVKHIYTVSGTYNVHCIANVNGVPFHIEKEVIIGN